VNALSGAPDVIAGVADEAETGSVHVGRTIEDETHGARKRQRHFAGDMLLIVVIDHVVRIWTVPSDLLDPG
jgi:hypothetical protein